VALYGAVLWMCGLAYYILERLLIRINGRQSLLGSAVGIDTKGLLSLLLYSVAIPLAFVNPWIAFAIYVVIAIMWFIPDRRIERKIVE
jgi:uncharacterized membrane protein